MDVLIKEVSQTAHSSERNHTNNTHPQWFCTHSAGYGEGDHEEKTDRMDEGFPGDTTTTKENTYVCY